MLLGFKSSIVSIDELELHLHPKFKKTILKNLKEIFPDIIFIVSTHDPLVIQSNTDKLKIIVLSKKNFSDKTNILEDIPEYMNMTTQQILSSPIFGLSTLGNNRISDRDIKLYYKHLKNDNWNDIEPLRNSLGKNGFFGTNFRELIALSAVDAYLAQNHNPKTENIIRILKDFDKNEEN